MQAEEDRVHRIMRDIAEGDSVGDKLVYDKDTKTLRPASSHEDKDRTIRVIPQDMDVYGGGDQETETEQDRVRRIMQDIVDGKFDARNVLISAPRKPLRRTGTSGDSVVTINVTPQDMEIYSTEEVSAS